MFSGLTSAIAAPTRRFPMNLWRRIRPFLSGTLRLFHISYLEAKVVNYRSYLGLWWVPLSTLIFTAVLGLVFRHSQLYSPADFFLYVLVGYVTWGFIQETVLESTGAIQSKFDFAVHNNLSMTGLFIKLLVDRLFIFALNLALVVAALIVLSPWRLNFNLFLFFPFLGLLTVTSLGVAYLVNLVTLLFPDLNTLIRVGVRFMFFLTPIFWSAAESTPSRIRGLLTTYNPASYYLSIARQVFSIEAVNPFTWLVAAILPLLLCGVGVATYMRTQGFVRNLK